jgi:hypothetical protein
MPLELLHVEDMGFVVRRDRSGGTAIGLAEEAFRFATALAETRETDRFAPDEVSTPPTYRPSAEEDVERVASGARLLVLAPDGLGLIEGRRRTERSPYGLWTPRGVDLSGWSWLL